jgi:FkbM family methyltransferase
MFYGQHREDEYLLSLFPDNNPENYKVCIEVGAYDGVNGSNTYHFEQKGWRALCIEPIDVAFQNCLRYRRECVNCCISSEDTEDKTFHIFALNSNLSAISGLEPDQRLIDSHSHLITDRKTCIAKVRSLTSLLDELNYPKNIDFISIDTENTELDVLKGIDFLKYNIRAMVIENNFNEPFCEDYLKQFGYKKIHRIAVNDFFVKELK